MAKEKSLNIAGVGLSKAALRMKKIEEELATVSFTDIPKAHRLLKQMDAFLKTENYPELQISFLLFSGFIENQEYHYKESKDFYILGLKLLEEHGDIAQQASARIDLAGTLINLEEIDQAKFYLDEAQRLINAFPNKNLEARIHCRNGFIQLYYKNYGEALELLHQAETILGSFFDELEIKDYYFLTLINSGLGFVYLASNEHDKVIKAQLNTVNLCETTGMQSRLSWHYLNIGQAYMSIDDFENAEFFFEKSIASPEDSGRKSRASAIGNLGFMAMVEKKYKKALKLFERAELIQQEGDQKDFSNLAQLNIWKARAFAEMGDMEESIAYNKLAYHQAGEAEDYSRLAEINKNLASSYAEEGQYQNAYNHILLREQFFKKYLDQLEDQRIMELDIRYETEKKRQETENLKLQATKLQLKALRAQMNPHFMHNALNAIQTYITFGDAKNASSYLARFSELMRKSLEFSDLEVISLEEEIDFLNEYLSLNQKLRFESNLKYEVKVGPEVEEDICGIPSMIIQPYVENAIEHGIRRKSKGMILVKFELLDEDTLLCIVEDDGVGRKEARRIQSEDPSFKNHRSRGTIITQDRLNVLFKNKGKDFVEIIDLTDDNGKGTGTRVEIRIPILEVNM